ncbi:MAG: PilX N-terminal domain-containing pilus assembly protein [Pseudomonadota bacterium]
MRAIYFRKNRQKGAALVIGLMLLVIITVLAVSAVNTASTELVMAGNEQYRERAFQAAEIGVERAIRALATVPQDFVTHTNAAEAVTALPQDNYTIASTYLGEDNDIPGYSAGKFVGLHYRIDSTGVSQRNAQSVHEQGAYVLGSGGGELVTWLPGASAP